MFKFELKSILESSFKRKKYNANKDKKVLIVEVNPCHAELLPSISKYFKDLGLDVDFLLNLEIHKQNPFYNLKSKVNNIYYLHYKFIRIFLSSYLCKIYDLIFFVSSYDYIINKTIPDSYSFNYIPKYGFLFMEHDYNNIENCTNAHKDIYDESRVFVLGVNNKNDKITELPCIYYGDRKIFFEYNEIISFVVAGMNSRSIENYILIVERLLSLELENFMFYILGSFDKKLIESKVNKKNLSSYIKVFGRVDFNTLYMYVEKGSFLIGPDNIDYYFERRVSGSRQLSLGFGVPLIVNKSLAIDWGFSEDECVVYENELFEGILNAYSMNYEDYKNMKHSVNVLSKNMQSQALKNLDVKLKQVRRIRS